MLSWGSDKTKGYTLEDLKNGKIIALCNINFHKDDTLSKLAHMETGLTWSRLEEIDNFVDNAIHCNGNSAHQAPAISSSRPEAESISKELGIIEISESDNKNHISNLQYLT